MATRRYYLYSRYERLWHWLQAFGVLLLMLTGATVHFPDALSVVPFSSAVLVHNALGIILVVNAFLGLFYYLTTGSIRQFIPEPHDFISLSFKQAMYYMRGIFRGDSHPLVKRPQRRMNPLQQVTYITILNVLIPLQMTTGLMMMSAQQWPGAVASVGGLAPFAMAHTLGAWLFVSFVLMHVYLTTTGHTPLSSLKAMVHGYEDVHEPSTDES